MAKVAKAGAARKFAASALGEDHFAERAQQLRGELGRLRKKFADSDLNGLLQPSDHEQLDLHLRHTHSLIRRAEAQGWRQDPQAFGTMERAELWVARMAEALRRSGNLKKQAPVMGNKYRAKQTDPSKIVRAERADPRIVPPVRWDAVQRRIANEQRNYLRTTQGLLHGRPVRGLASRHLLSGFLRCGGCGSALVASGQYIGSGKTRRYVRVFVCNYRSHRGPTACPNGARPQMEQLDQAVLGAIERWVLNPEVIRRAAKRAIAIRTLERAKDDRGAKLRKQLA